MKQKLQRLLLCLTLVLGFINANANAIELKSTLDFQKNTLGINPVPVTNSTTSSNLEGKVFNGVTFSGKRNNATAYPSFRMVSASNTTNYVLLMNTADLIFKAPSGYRFEEVTMHYRAGSSYYFNGSISGNHLKWTSNGSDAVGIAPSLGDSDENGTWKANGDVVTTLYATGGSSRAAQIVSIDFTLAQTGGNGGAIPHLQHIR